MGLPYLHEVETFCFSVLYFPHHLKCQWRETPALLRSARQGEVNTQRYGLRYSTQTHLTTAVCKYSVKCTVLDLAADQGAKARVGFRNMYTDRYGR